MRTGPKTKPPLERFLPKIEFTDSCWLWTAAKDTHGHGRFYDGDRLRPAHCVGWELTVGPIPEGLVLDHLCRVRHCVNPDHLEPVTQRVNLIRGEGFAGLNYRKTHCVNGHPFNEEHTVMYNGKRYCRTCGVARARRSRELTRAS